MVDDKGIEYYNDLTSLVIKNTGTSPIYNCQLYLNDTRKGYTYFGASGNVSDSNTPVTNAFKFRTGSITKPFTAAIIFQLMEEGAFNLSDRLVDLVDIDTKAFLEGLLVVNQVDYTNLISIQNLLAHTSGLNDYFSDDDRFFEHVTQHPIQSWNWKKVMGKYFEFKLNERASFKPGEGFHYSDTNYLLLAVLIEEVCKAPLHVVLENRILKPLQLSETFLEFYQETRGTQQVVYPYHGITWLKDINTSFDWGGGGLVSNARDLDTFVRALVSGRLFAQDATLNEMMAIHDNNHGSKLQRRQTYYGMGVQHKIISGISFIGHTSAYGALVYYDPINEVSIVISLNQVYGLHKAEWLMYKVLEEYLS